MGALVGIRVRQGALDLHAPAPVPEWRGAGDPRGAITLDQLLRMSSGLEFGEATDEYDADLATMLFDRGDTAAYAAAKPLEHPPDSHWHYSSGTANIVSRIVRHSFEGDQAAHFSFPRRGALRSHRNAKRGDRAGRERELRRVVVHVRHGARLGALRAALPERRRLAGRAHPARGLGGSTAPRRRRRRRRAATVRTGG